METAIFYVQLIAVVVLLLVFLAGTLQVLERTFPRFSRWLDGITGDERPF